MIELVISGGQTGADQAGWRAAKAAGIPTGGYMPLDWRTEDGFHPEFMSEYGAEEWPELCLTVAEQYRERTRANVRKSDATLWFGDVGTPGYMATNAAVVRSGKKMLPIMTSSDIHPMFVATWLQKFRVLNIAGNRESKAPGIGAWVEAYMMEVFRILKAGTS